MSKVLLRDSQSHKWSSRVVMHHKSYLSLFLAVVCQLWWKQVICRAVMAQSYVISLSTASEERNGIYWDSDGNCRLGNTCFQGCKFQEMYVIRRINKTVLKKDAKTREKTLTCISRRLHRQWDDDATKPPYHVSFLWKNLEYALKLWINKVNARSMHLFAYSFILSAPFWSCRLVSVNCIHTHYCIARIFMALS